MGTHCGVQYWRIFKEYNAKERIFFPFHHRTCTVTELFFWYPKRFILYKLIYVYFLFVLLYIRSDCVREKLLSITVTWEEKWRSLSLPTLWSSWDLWQWVPLDGTIVFTGSYLLIKGLYVFSCFILLIWEHIYIYNVLMKSCLIMYLVLIRFLEWTGCCCSGTEALLMSNVEALFDVSGSVAARIETECRDLKLHHQWTSSCDALRQLPLSIPLDSSLGYWLCVHLIFLVSYLFPSNFFWS